MKDELITYETAKLAKEKGFDELCEYGYYDLEENHKLNGTYKNFSDAYTTGLPKRRNSEGVSYCISPTQSLLQKWLREKHEINCIPIPYDNRYESNIYWDGFTDEELHEDFLEENMFDTYELALEDSLYSALNLIKI